MNEWAGRTEPGGAGVTGFCVLGLESTAPVPGDEHRIVELALIQVDAHGDVLNRWHTLVNPQQKLGLFGAHGLTDADLQAAPSFAQIAGRVTTRLAGRVVVAHNARFVVDLLVDELARAGLPAPVELEPVCTMQLARDVLPGAGRSLADCGAAYGLDTVLDTAADGGTTGTGSPAGPCVGALGTAAATTALLRAYLHSADCLDTWSAALDRAAALHWPAPAERGGTVCARPRLSGIAVPAAADGPIVPQPRFRTRAPLRLPDFTGPDDQLDYLALLDRCLVDGTLLTHAPAHPLSLLTEHARRTHLDAVTRTRLHRGYAEQLLRAALADGALTSVDRAELGAVLRLLGADLDTELAHSTLSTLGDPLAERFGTVVPDRSAPAAPLPSVSLPAVPVTLTRGDTIVLTESLTRGTAAWAREIVARGFTVAAAVTLRTRLVVACDPTALSGKTVKARDYGIPIVSEFALRSVMGVD